jgi:hypothetical protein
MIVFQKVFLKTPWNSFVLEQAFLSCPRYFPPCVETESVHENLKLIHILNEDD